MGLSPDARLLFDEPTREGLEQLPEPLVRNRPGRELNLASEPGVETMRVTADEQIIDEREHPALRVDRRHRVGFTPSARIFL